MKKYVENMKEYKEIYGKNEVIVKNMKRYVGSM